MSDLRKKAQVVLDMLRAEVRPASIAVETNVLDAMVDLVRKEKAPDLSHLKWTLLTVVIEENMAHGFPYIYGIYQQQGTGALKRGKAIYVLRSDPELACLDLDKLPPTTFRAMAGLQAEGMRLVASVEKEPV